MSNDYIVHQLSDKEVYDKVIQEDIGSQQHFLQTTFSNTLNEQLEDEDLQETGGEFSEDDGDAISDDSSDDSSADEKDHVLKEPTTKATSEAKPSNNSEILVDTDSTVVAFVKENICIDYESIKSRVYNEVLDRNQEFYVHRFFQKHLLVLYQLLREHSICENPFFRRNLCRSTLKTIFQNNTTALKDLFNVVVKDAERNFEYILDKLYGNKDSIVNIHFFIKLLLLIINEAVNIFISPKLSTQEKLINIEKNVLDKCSTLMHLIKPTSILFIYSACSPFVDYKDFYNKQNIKKHKKTEQRENTDLHIQLPQLNRNFTFNFIYKLHKQKGMTYLENPNWSKRFPVSLEQLFEDVDCFNVKYVIRFVLQKLKLLKTKSLEELIDDNHSHPLLIKYITYEIQFSRLQKEALAGIIYGDGCIKATGNFTFSQSVAHIDYFVYVAFIFCNTIGNIVTDKGGRYTAKDGKSFIRAESYTFDVRQNAFLEEVRDMIYSVEAKLVNGEIKQKRIKKINETFLRKYFTMFSLSFLISDDGAAHGASVIICTDCFQLEELVLFQRILRDICQVTCTVRKNSVTRISTATFRTIKSVLLTFTEPTMHYKLEGKLRTDAEANKLIINDCLIKKYKLYVVDNDRVHCLLCASKFYTSPRASVHLRNNHRPAIHICEQCNIVFSSLHNYTNHHDSKHAK